MSALQRAPTVAEVGGVIDAHNARAGIYRTLPDSAGRLLGEVVELCLAAGMTVGDMAKHMDDAVYNQAVKASAHAGHTIFPSQLGGQSTEELASEHAKRELTREIADCRLQMLDVMHKAGITEADVDCAQAEKWAAFTQAQVRVSDNGTCYAVKPHVIAPAAAAAGAPTAAPTAAPKSVADTFSQAWINDAHSEHEQTAIATLVASLPGPSGRIGSPEESERCAWLALDWLVRVQMSKWLKFDPAAGAIRAELAGLAKIDSAQGLEPYRATLARAEEHVGGLALRQGCVTSDSRKLVGLAAGFAADELAHLADDDAAGLALHVIEHAARQAVAIYGADAPVLQDAVRELQQSALDLLAQMIAVCEQPRRA